MSRRQLYRHDLIDAAIKEKGLTNKKLARLARCTPNTISRLRQEEYNPTLKTFLVVCAKLDLGPEKVLDLAA